MKPSVCSGNVGAENFLKERKMKNKKVICLLLLCSLFVLTSSGCCSIFSGSTQKITISSTPPGAKVTADNGTSIITPGSIVLERKSKHTLVAELTGHESQQVQLEQRLNNWVWANILIGGLIGLAIDMVSGAINELHPQEVDFNFEDAPDGDASAANTSILYQDMLFRRENAYSLSRKYKTAA